MKYKFPALLYEDKDNPGYTVITFPDLLGIGSECEKGKEKETAEEVLSLALTNSYRRSIEPTNTEILKNIHKDCEVILVEVDKSEPHTHLFICE